MKIKWGALVVDGRGKLGGHVAAQNRGGSYLRTKVTPSNPQTTFQTAIRQLFGSISIGWGGLTPSAIKAWNAAVDEWKSTNIFGDLKQPSGKALYQRLNMQAIVANFSAIPLPPAKAEIPFSNVSAIAFDISDASITATGLYSGTDAAVIMFSSGPVTSGTTFVKNLMRVVSVTNGGAYSPTTAYSQYVGRFGIPVAGQKVFIGYKIVLPNGQASPMQIVESAVVA